MELEFQFWFFAVVLLFILCGKEVLALYIALPIIIHEAGHLIVMALLHVPVRRIAFTPFSVDIVRGPGSRLSLSKEIVIGLGGIIANLVMALCLYLFAFQSMRMMFLVAANIAVALFNLLPIGSLDGGQITKQICNYCFMPQAARTISKIVSFLVLTPLFGFGIWMLLQENGNFTLLLSCGYLAAAVIFRE